MPVSVCAFGQAAGLIEGTITDPENAAISGASVVCSNVNTGIRLQTRTNTEGIFRFPELPIGTYEITATMPGFQVVKERTDLLTGDALNLKLQLKVGSVSETIEVTGEAPVVQSATSEVKTTMDSRQMSELPLNGRNPLDLVVLTPGADYTATGTSPGQQDNTGVTVNGLRSTDNNYQLDGASFTNNFYGSAPTLPNPDMLGEFTVQSADFSARESRAGALVQLSTRSGTNRWAGSAFEFLRNDKMDARNFFGAQRSPFKRSQAGASVGGPLVRNRTFLFASYQATIGRGGPSPKLLTVPSVAQVNGDFSAPNLASKIIVDPTNGQPWADNIIPKTRFSPAASKLLFVFPAPNIGSNTARIPTNADVNDHQFLVKVDHHFSLANNLTVRYYFDRNEFQRDTTSPPGIYALNDYRNQILTVQDSHILTPRFTVTGSFSYSQNFRNQIPNAPIFNQDLTSLVSKAQSTTGKELRMNINNYFNFLSGGPLQFNPKAMEFRPQAVWSHGTHLIGFGSDMLWDREYTVDNSVGAGTWTFEPTRTANTAIRGSVGDSFASLLLGVPLTFQQTSNAPNDFRQARYHFWVQDDWKVSRRVTLNLGLRWEPSLPPVDLLGPLPGFAPGLQSRVAPKAPPGLIFSGDVTNSILPRDWNNLAPRVGLAWDVSGSGKLVVRAGLGIYYHVTPVAASRAVAVNGSFRALNVTVNNPLSFDNPWGNYPGGNPFPYTVPTPDQLQGYGFPARATIGALDPYAKSGYTEAWNFAVERQVFRDTSLKVSYVANHSIGIMGGTEGNPAVYGPGATAANIDSRRLYAGIASMTLISPFQGSNYHSMQVSVTKRTRSGLSILANYVFSKALDDGTNGGLGQLTGQPRNPFNRNMDKGPADFDVTQRANIALLYDLPRLTHNAIGGTLVNGWQLNTIITLQTGYPYTPTSGQRALVGGAADFGDIVGDPARPAGADPVQQWYNIAAFVLPPTGGYGNAGRNILRGPGKQVVNFSTFKNFRATERLTLQFRFEAFNFFNHANFGLPNAATTARFWRQRIRAYCSSV
jgi:hypothetical protein